MATRTFVVTVTDSPPRVIVEDVRNRAHTVVEDLAKVGGQIERLISAPSRPVPPPRPGEPPETV